jgi:hypothetical protein
MPLRPQQFTSCTAHQGITSTWEDVYSLFLDGQWIDITDVPAGPYVLESEVNPERLYMETSYDNNAAAIVVDIP